MNKSDAIRRIARETRLSQRVIVDVIDASHRLIEEEVRKGGRIVFPGFGTFATRERQDGTVRSIRTGEPVAYAARRVASFRVGAYLKRAAAGKQRR